jgi:hypothetical protein
MASITRTNGIGHADTTLYSTAQLDCYIVTLGSSATFGVGGTAEKIAAAVQPLMIEFDDDGVIMVVDGHAHDATSLKRAINAVTGGSETPTLRTSLKSMAP